MMRWLLVALLLAGCATLPPFATEESMADRATCLKAGSIWVETQRVYDCHAPVAPRAYPSPMPGGGFIVPNGEPQPVPIPLMPPPRLDFKRDYVPHGVPL